jgi:uncharacterized protein involved in outer membrane biogenesis
MSCPISCSLKTVTKYFAILLAILVTSVLILVLCINPNQYKAQLSKLFLQHTGKQLSIGNLQWRILPTLAVAATDLKIDGVVVTLKEARLNLAWLDLLRAHLSPNFTLLLQPDTYVNITVKNFKTKNNQLDSLELDGHLANGNIKGNLRPATNHPQQLQGSIHLQDIDIQQLLQILKQHHLASGKLQATITLEDFANYALNIQAKNGSIQGIDVHHLLRTAEKNITELEQALKRDISSSIGVLLGRYSADFKINNNDQTRFDTLTVDAKFHNHVTNNLNMTVQHPDYKIDGNGSVNLLKQQLSLKVGAQLQLTNKENTSEVSTYLLETPIMIQIHGPLSQPNVTADTQAYVKAAIDRIKSGLLKNITGDFLKIFKKG